MNDAIPEGFELVNCPGCGNTQWTVAYRGKDWILDPNRGVQIVRCDACGLHFTNPRPDADHVAAYYQADYAPFQKQRGELQRDSSLSTVVRTWIVADMYGAPRFKPRGWRGAVAKTCRLFRDAKHYGFGVPYQGTGQLLDFGCGNGTFMRRMSAVGWTCTGLDFSATAVASVNASGIRALLGTLPHPELAPESFDVITMRQALEHVPAPREVLVAALKILRPGGAIMIDVPNFDSWEIQYFGDAAQTLQIPRHFLHFTAPTLAALLLNCGFETTSVRQVCRPGWIQKSVHQLDRRVSKKWDRLLKFKVATRLASRIAQHRGKGNELIARARKPG